MDEKREDKIPQIDTGNISSVDLSSDVLADRHKMKKEKQRKREQDLKTGILEPVTMFVGPESLRVMNSNTSIGRETRGESSRIFMRNLAC